MIYSEYTLNWCKIKQIFKMKKVKCVQDESSHWYIIPEELVHKYNQLSGRLYETNFEDYDLINEFEEIFSKYRTGGDLNNIQLYAEI